MMNAQCEMDRKVKFGGWTFVGPVSVTAWDLDFKPVNDVYLNDLCGATHVRFTDCDFYQDGEFKSTVDVTKPYWFTGVNFGEPCRVEGRILYAIGDEDDTNGESPVLLVRRGNPSLKRFKVSRKNYISGWTSSDDEVEFHFTHS